jgi:hypothetical protein
MQSFKVTDEPNAQVSSEHNEPLFLYSPVTVDESSLLIMAFAVRHKLSGVALQDCCPLLHCIAQSQTSVLKR